MQLISKNDAVNALEPYLPNIYDCIHSAWDDYLKYPDWARIEHSSTTRANIVYDHMIKKVIKAIVDDRLVKHFQWSKNQHIFVFEQYISLRLKKLGQDLMPQNIQTGRVKNLNRHELIPGIPAASHLVAGYTLNDLETKIEDIYLVCPNNNKTYWESKINSGVESTNICDIFEYNEQLSNDENYSSDFERKDSENKEIEVTGYDRKNQP